MKQLDMSQFKESADDDEKEGFFARRFREEKEKAARGFKRYKEFLKQGGSGLVEGAVALPDLVLSGGKWLYDHAAGNEDPFEMMLTNKLREHLPEPETKLGEYTRNISPWLVPGGILRGGAQGLAKGASLMAAKQGAKAGAQGALKRAALGGALGAGGVLAEEADVPKPLITALQIGGSLAAGAKVPLKVPEFHPQGLPKRGWENVPKNTSVSPRAKETAIASHKYDVNQARERVGNLTNKNQLAPSPQEIRQAENAFDNLSKASENLSKKGFGFSSESFVNSLWRKVNGKHSQRGPLGRSPDEKLYDETIDSLVKEIKQGHVSVSDAIKKYRDINAQLKVGYDVTHNRRLAAGEKEALEDFGKSLEEDISKSLKGTPLEGKFKKTNQDWSQIKAREELGKTWESLIDGDRKSAQKYLISPKKRAAMKRYMGLEGEKRLSETFSEILSIPHPEKQLKALEAAGASSTLSSLASMLMLHSPQNALKAAGAVGMAKKSYKSLQQARLNNYVSSVEGQRQWKEFASYMKKGAIPQATRVLKAMQQGMEKEQTPKRIPMLEFDEEGKPISKRSS